jgi:outer membrane protein
MTPKYSSFTLFSLMLLLGAISNSTVKAQTNTVSVYRDFSDTQWDLEDVLTISLANNPDLRRATLSVEDAERLVFIAYSNLAPDISTSMNYTRNVEIPVNFIPESVFDPNGDPNKLVPIAFGTDNNWQGGFTIEQNIFQGPALVGVSTATIFRAVQTENYRATAQNVITQARLAYYGVLISQEVARLQVAQISRLEENLAQNKKEPN